MGRSLRLLYTFSPTVAMVAAAGFVARRERRTVLSGGALGVTRVAGGVIFVLGFLLRVWGTWAFWSEGRGTPLPPYWPQRLVTTGPFRYTRNPLYVGMLAMAAGLGLCLTSARLLLGTAALWALLQWAVVPAEERRLETQFGEAYQRYRGRVPPWLW